LIEYEEENAEPTTKILKATSLDGKKLREVNGYFANSISFKRIKSNRRKVMRADLPNYVWCHPTQF